MSVHEKTYSGRIKAKQLELRKKLRDGLEEEEEGTANHSQTGVQLPQNAPAPKVILIKGEPKMRAKKGINKHTHTVYFNLRNTCLKKTTKLYLLPYPLRYSILYSIVDRNIEKESIREFINKKREMFYLEV